MSTEAKFNDGPIDPEVLKRSLQRIREWAAKNASKKLIVASIPPDTSRATSFTEVWSVRREKPST